MLIEYMYKDATKSDETLMVIDGKLVVACDEYAIRGSCGNKDGIAIDCIKYADEDIRVRTAMFILTDEDRFVDYVNDRELDIPMSLDSIEDESDEDIEDDGSEEDGEEEE